MSAIFYLKYIFHYEIFPVNYLVALTFFFLIALVQFLFIDTGATFIRHAGTANRMPPSIC